MLLMLLAVSVACERSGEAVVEQDGRPLVVATLHPIASVAEVVGGEAVRVLTLLPPGAHPDTYEARPRDAEALAGAELVVKVGGAADDWLPEKFAAPVVVMTEDMELVAEHGHGTGNPHVWLDPILVRDRLLPALTRALARIAPDSAEAIHARADAFADSLSALDMEIRAMLEDVPTRRFVAAHAAWPYFAERYGLEGLAAVHESPGVEVGTRGLARLVAAARSAGVRAVIAEPQLGRAGVDALAAELDARVEMADPVGGVGMEGREDYLSLMRFNARAFARALGAV